MSTGDNELCKCPMPSRVLNSKIVLRTDLAIVSSCLLSILVS